MGTGKDLWTEFETLTNKHDWAGAASLFASDAVYILPGGGVTKGLRPSQDSKKSY